MEARRREPVGETGAQAKLRVEDLHKAFDGKVVLDGLSFSVKDGESLVIVGPSGTGKSVLLKHLIGLIRPDSGRVFVDGKDVWAISDRERNQLRKQFGMSFQEGALFDSMSVFDNVAFPLRRSGRPAREVRQRVRECLDIVHLPDVEEKRPSELSGGMRRRVGFARAIAHEPDILLFDEPNTGLDPIMTDIIDEVILNMRERMDVTIVTITHHMPSARKIGDRIALLYGGKILFEAPPEEFLASQDPAVRQFVDGSAEGPLTPEGQVTGKRKSSEGGA
ncbi:MAG TPA: ABC transporter ATP-binding protein [Thermoanaerobaculia bacterium]|nr:ABC transporter ATP-binding protein [Thermoanaerobaculia bacterium]